MQICKICGRPIKYIALNIMEYIQVDPEQLEVFTENGHRQKAYKKHECQKPEDKENAGE